MQIATLVVDLLILVVLAIGIGKVLLALDNIIYILFDILHKDG